MITPALHADTLTETFTDRCLATDICQESVYWQVPNPSGSGFAFADEDFSIVPASYIPGLDTVYTQTYGPCSDWDCVAEDLGLPVTALTETQFPSEFAAFFDSVYQGDTPAAFQPYVFTDPPDPAPEPSTLAMALFLIPLLLVKRSNGDVIAGR